MVVVAGISCGWGGVDDVGGFVVGSSGGWFVMVLVDVVGGSGELILGGGCHGGLAVGVWFIWVYW